MKLICSHSLSRSLYNKVFHGNWEREKVKYSRIKKKKKKNVKKKKKEVIKMTTKNKTRLDTITKHDKEEFDDKDDRRGEKKNSWTMISGRQ